MQANKISDYVKLLWLPMMGFISAIIFFNSMDQRIETVSKSQEDISPYVRKNSDDILSMKEMQKTTYSRVEELRQDIQVIRHEQTIQYREMIKAIHEIEKEKVK